MWGIFYFFLLLFERLTKFPERIGKMRHVYALFWILIGWVIFRSDSLKEALVYLGAMAGCNGVGIWQNNFEALPLGNLIFVVIGIAGSTPVFSNLEQKKQRKNVVEYSIRNHDSRCVCSGCKRGNQHILQSVHLL